MHFKPDDVFSLIKGLTKQGFYGRLEISVENGKITHCAKVQTFKPQTSIKIIELTEEST